MPGILDQIGNTPMVRLRHLVPDNGGRDLDEARVPQPDGLDEGSHGPRLAEQLGPAAVIATIAVDTGFKYTSVAPYQGLGG
ncbi:MAG TPA: hypothetical protein VND88_04375 [Candidatus Acidoferrales bacterium]|nr:hypothetical protein [Candidatus Acidoferrales bacterium]